MGAVALAQQQHTHRPRGLVDRHREPVGRADDGNGDARRRADGSRPGLELGPVIHVGAPLDREGDVDHLVQQDAVEGSFRAPEFGTDVEAQRVGY